MKIITDINGYINSKEPLAAAYGYFDGIHLGHKALIKATKVNGMKRGVVTFSNSPAAFCMPNVNIRRIMSLDDKINFFASQGVDYLFMFEFNEAMKNMSKEDFVEKYVSGLNVKYAVVGFNYTFGRAKTGNKSDFRKLCSAENTKVRVMRPVRCEGEIISSTAIRKYIQSGNIKKANAMLGHSFSLEGRVVAGNKIGRNIGFPTANVAVGEDMIIPKWGVYHTNVIINGRSYTGLTNVGDNPTVMAGRLSVETYILNFNKNIYGRNVRIEFVDFIRDEKKFADKEALRQQISHDLETVKKHAAEGI